jgi:Flp pilus assembly CpaF family ATPase
MNICQRIVSQVGRRVDESSPICDARLPTVLVSTSSRRRWPLTGRR